MQDQPQLRGIYSKKEERVSTFANGVPVFDTIPDCLQWLEQHSQIGSNPFDPSLQHIFTHSTDWNQVSALIISKLRSLRADPNSHVKIDRDKNKVLKENEFKPVLNALRSKLDLSFHQETNVEATLNTLQYLFHHMRSGILVVIRNNELKMFAPFVNKHYTNNWGHLLKTDPKTMEDYYTEKRDHYRRENIIPDKTKWWANGNIICNEHSPPGETYTQWWGDNLLSQLKHMFETVCKEREIPDVEFFINKRDHPHLKSNLTEPYDFVFDQKDKILEKHAYQCYTPILSFYCSPDFADLPCPTTEDWESVVGKVFPPSFIRDRGNKIRTPRDLYLESNFKKFDIDWDQKVNTAFFRGTATGSGTNAATNQRINAAKMSADWSKSGLNKAPGDTAPLLDAGITGFNVRDKKRLGEPMRFTRRDAIGVEKAQYIPMYEQGKFKYIMYIDGHCAANRYSFLMRLGSVIFKVKSAIVASEMWYFPLLQPYLGSKDNNIDVQVDGADHIPIEADLSDLRDKILWCRENDAKCQMIAANAKSRWHRCLSREPLLDYLQVMLVGIADNYQHPAPWVTIPEEVGAPLTGEPNGMLCDQSDRDNPKLCARCKEYQEPPKKRKVVESNSATPKKVETCRKCRKPKGRCACRENNA